jgi:D-alanyl-D-alanine carboxypeptidase (penicillin-binding protein 5/6)
VAAHARPRRSRRTKALVTAAGLVGIVTPVAASTVASAAPVTHSDTQADPETAADTVSKGPTGLHTAYAYLADAADGHALWSGSKAQSAMPMGSITKVMTALVVVKHHSADLDKMVTVKQEYRDYVQEQGASTADLKTGDKLTVRQLLSAMLVPSGCDAAQALADTFGQGDTLKQRVDSFVGQMNSEAGQLGLANTHFDSPDGISEKKTNHSSPADLAKLGAAALNNTTLAGVVHQTSGREVATNGRVYTWDNTDKLLTDYKGALGIKTGSGPDDGYCLLFAAKRNGHTLVGAVLQDTKDRFDDAASILDWGFAHAG